MRVQVNYDAMLARENTRYVLPYDPKTAVPVDAIAAAAAASATPAPSLSVTPKSLLYSQPPASGATNVSYDPTGFS